MPETTIPVTFEVRDLVRSHKRGGESYNDLLRDVFEDGIERTDGDSDGV